MCSSGFDTLESDLINGTNQAPGWLTNVSQQPQSVVISIKLHAAANHPNDHHLKATVTPQMWQQLKTQPLPWTISLPPKHLIVLRP
ncbi:MAG: hypothetical protein AAF635_08840 [Cyanobacteria bacterium P01_C01_bin.69]